VTQTAGAQQTLDRAVFTLTAMQRQEVDRVGAQALDHRVRVERFRKAPATAAPERTDTSRSLLEPPLSTTTVVSGMEAHAASGASAK
jgi:hypothetical protein